MLKGASGIISFLLIVSSCGVDQRGYTSLEVPQEGQEVDLGNFNTRLSNNLLISGERCIGGEIAESAEQVFYCRSGQWLVRVDTINECAPEGCTEHQVFPIIADLNASTFQESTSFYDIIPTIPVDENISTILRSVTVRFRTNNLPRVLYK